MDQKTISWVRYITIIGWVIALVSYNSSNNKSSLARFHLRESFGIFATGIALYIAVFIMPSFLFTPLLVSLFLFYGYLG